jgi:hypothetical protein
MPNTHLLVSILLLSSCYIAAGQGSASKTSKIIARSASKLKVVELDGKHRIEVPDDFTMGRVSEKIASVPVYYFNATPPDYTSIQIFLLPNAGTYQTDPKTGGPRLPIEIDGTSLRGYFKISGERYVYYGWSVGDNAYECTMNSPCPVPVPPKSRYDTLYVFVVFDEANNTIVEFRGDHLGPTERVTRFEGDGKLLRDVIVPSLSSIR